MSDNSRSRANGDEIELEGDEPERIRDRLESELGELFGIGAHRETAGAIIFLVGSRQESEHGERLDIRTCIYDREDKDLIITDNGIWIPSDASEILASISGGVHSRIDESELDLGPIMRSSISTPISSLLELELDRGPSESREWGYGAGPPPDISRIEERLEEAGLELEERFIMLEFGGKAPFTPGNRDGHVLTDSDGLTGNYGIYAHREDRLIIIDIDEPELAELEELPDTFTVESASAKPGSGRGHYYFVVDEPERFYDLAGLDNPHPSGVGELRASNGYVVGPGCEIECGSYEIVEDRPIREISSEELLEWIEIHRDRRSAPDELEEEPEPDPLEEDPAVVLDRDRDEIETVVCSECDREIPIEEARELARVAGRSIYACADVCEEGSR